jgi:hypothetical protein
VSGNKVKIVKNVSWLQIARTLSFYIWCELISKPVNSTEYFTVVHLVARWLILNVNHNELKIYIASAFTEQIMVSLKVKLHHGLIPFVCWQYTHGCEFSYFIYFVDNIRMFVTFHILFILLALYACLWFFIFYLFCWQYTHGCDFSFSFILLAIYTWLWLFIFLLFCWQYTHGFNFSYFILFSIL